MLSDLDRIIVAVRERRTVAHALHQVLGAEVTSHAPLPIWAAERTTLRAGTGEIELLSPRGVGAVAHFIARRGPGIFAVGFATGDLEKFRRHLGDRGVSFEEDAGQLFVTSDKGVDLPGLNLVVAPSRTRAPVGLLQRFCGATLLHRFADPDGLLRILGARPSQLSNPGEMTRDFTGSVIHVGHGSHLAILAPRGMDGPVAHRFYERGPGVYWVTATTGHLAEIRERLASRGRSHPTPADDGSMLLPPRLVGGLPLALLPSTLSCSRYAVHESVLPTAGA